MDITIIVLGSVALLAVVITISSMGKVRVVEDNKQTNRKPKLKPQPKEKVKEVVVERQIERRQQMALYRLADSLKKREQDLEIELKRHQLAKESLAVENLQLAKEKEKAYMEQQQKMYELKKFMDNFKMLQREWKLEQSFKELKNYNRDVLFLKKQIDTDQKLKLRELKLERDKFNQVMASKEQEIKEHYNELRHKTNVLMIDEKMLLQKKRSIEQDMRDLALEKKGNVIEIQGRVIDQKTGELDIKKQALKNYFDEEKLLLKERDIDKKMNVMHAIQDGWHLADDWKAIHALKKHGYEMDSPLIPRNYELQQKVRELEHEVILLNEAKETDE